MREDAEIDIVATDPSRTKFLVGECKYKDTPFDISEMEALARFAPDKRAAAVHYYLFSKSGFTDGVKKRAEEQGVRLVGLDDML